MAYGAAISRSEPTCIIFLVDQSTSMGDPIDATTDGDRRKSVAVAKVLNEMLYELCLRCAGPDRVEDYFEIAVLGYGATVGSAYDGALSGRDLVTTSELAANPAGFEERYTVAGDSTQRMRIPKWVTPRAAGATPMGSALRIASALVDRFLTLHPRCFPPVVINLTDGEPTDHPHDEAEALRARASEDGNVLLFNLHLGTSSETSVVFPDTMDRLGSPLARELFAMSSVLPAPMRTTAILSGYEVSDRSRGFACNADLSVVVQFLDIGTRALEVR